MSESSKASQNWYTRCAQCGHIEPLDDVKSWLGLTTGAIEAKCSKCGCMKLWLHMKAEDPQ